MKAILNYGIIELEEALEINFIDKLVAEAERILV